MNIYHFSRKTEYRMPFGAAPTEGKVKLCVKTDFCPDRIMLRLWNGAESLVPMNKEEDFLYSAEIVMPEKPCLLWYYFVAEKDGRKVFCCKGQGGGCETLEFCNDASWQITVYDKDFRTPQWFKKAVMYQIFPDRFFKSGNIADISCRNSEYIIHDDWYEPVFFNRHPCEDGPACNDFFGGNIRGIIEKIPYFKELGISVIYLNPIFEAFSNHRYDTGDYSKIDPILGSLEDFEELCRLCESEGIRIILDGVFSHTGSDSVYFNKYGHYGEGIGAYRDWNSRFRNWYQWNEHGYESWWGCSNLPNVNELEPTYIDYILRGEDAIIKKWLKHGAMGWRLDVADELPDEFIKILREQVKTQNPEAVVIGEVWEDASNKESYGVCREYLLGYELDSVMNYPFKDNVIAFLCGHIDAFQLNDSLMTLAEHYPSESLYSAMNLLGTHDTVRIKNALSGQYIDSNMSKEEKLRFRLDPVCETLALKRLRIAAFLQMTFMGVPCIYYGDEIGMQGLSDPCNRMPYTWRCVDVELLEYYKKLTRIRNSEDCLSCGSFETVFAKGDVFAYARKISDGKDVFGNPANNAFLLCAVNRSTELREFTAEVQGMTVLKGRFSGKEFFSDNGQFTICMDAFEAEIFDMR